MKILPTAHTIRTTIISFAAVSAMALPLLASASNHSARNVGVVYHRSDLVSTTSNADLYARLQDASRKICGSSSIIVTGSLRRASGNTECYNGTLSAAVERLDDPAVKALHNK